MTLLDRIMTLTSAIEGRVALADWAGATDLDLERRELLRELFATQPEAARDNGARAILEQLRARTDETAAAIHDTRRALAEASRQLRTSPDMVRGYANNSERNPTRVAETAAE